MVESSTDTDKHASGIATEDATVVKLDRTTSKATEIDDQEVFTIESDNSPYPEVRANVPNTDDVDLPVNTLRMWFLGVLFTVVSQYQVLICDRN